MSDAYHRVRLTRDARRSQVWSALWHYHFSRLISADDCVLDLGCGYGDFINSVVARRRIALDAWPEFVQHVAAGVEAHVGSVTDLGFLGDGSVNFALASNLFEHLTQAQLTDVLQQLRQKLAPGGTLAILQPNYRYAYREYFDDYTHLTIYSHVGLADFLAANGYEVIDVRARFLPLTVKSRLPTSPFLIGLYLNSPLKPFAKQMFLMARPGRRR